MSKKLKERDTLGNRMKRYEAMHSSPRLLDYVPAVARMDGKSFHTFTRGMGRPFDATFSSLMVETMTYLVKETGASAGYTQSDEISLVWEQSKPESQLIFDGRVSKMVSILASMTTAYFNRLLWNTWPSKALKLPVFDARVFSVSSRSEAVRYLAWREADATRNSITMAAHSVYSHRDLHRKSSAEKQEMLFQKGINWNDYPNAFKRGTYCIRRKIVRKYLAEEIEMLPAMHEARKNPDLVIERTDTWVPELPPIRRLANAVQVVFEGAEPIAK